MPRRVASFVEQFADLNSGRGRLDGRKQTASLFGSLGLQVPRFLLSRPAPQEHLNAGLGRGFLSRLVFVSGLRAGRSAVRQVSTFDTSTFRSQVAAAK